MKRWSFDETGWVSMATGLRSEGARGRPCRSLLGVPRPATDDLRGEFKSYCLTVVRDRTRFMIDFRIYVLLVANNRHHIGITNC